MMMHLPTEDDPLPLPQFTLHVTPSCVHGAPAPLAIVTPTYALLFLALATHYPGPTGRRRTCCQVLSPLLALPFLPPVVVRLH